MQFSVYPGTATNTGTAAAGNRTGSCTGTALATNQVLTGTSAPVVERLAWPGHRRVRRASASSPSSTPHADNTAAGTRR